MSKKTIYYIVGEQQCLLLINRTIKAGIIGNKDQGIEVDFSAVNINDH
jgi:hypothetical protein